MTFKELYTDKVGIFESMFKTEHPDDYTQIFGDTDPTILDGYTLVTYGNSELISAISEANHLNIIPSIISINLSSWVKQAQTLALEYDVLNPIIKENEVNETATRDETKVNDVTNAKKFFNDGEFTDGQREQTESEQGWQETKTRSDITKGIGSTDVVNVIRKELALRELDIKKKIVRLLINEITLQVY